MPSIAAPQRQDFPPIVGVLQAGNEIQAEDLECYEKVDGSSYSATVNNGLAALHRCSQSNAIANSSLQFATELSQTGCPAA